MQPEDAKKPSKAKKRTTKKSPSRETPKKPKARGPAHAKAKAKAKPKAKPKAKAKAADKSGLAIAEQDQHVSIANLKTAVRGAYDIQQLRIQMGNRIVANFKVKHGQAPGEREATMDTEGKLLLQALRLAYDKLTDGVVKFPQQLGFKGDELISSYTELCLIAMYTNLAKEEAEHFKRLGHILNDYPIWCNWLEGVKGVGPAMGAVIIAEFDIAKARYPSSLWAYAGLDVAADGRGRSRRAEHLVDREYKTKDGKIDTRKSITFNPFLKTKLVGVLGASFLKVGRDKSPYAAAYYDYRHRLENHTRYGVANDKKKDDAGKMITSKGRRHNMAIRYIIKLFLIDLYKSWRLLEGLEVAPPYSEAKLGHAPHNAADESA